MENLEEFLGRFIFYQLIEKCHLWRNKTLLHQQPPVYQPPMSAHKENIKPDLSKADSSCTDALKGSARCKRHSAIPRKMQLTVLVGELRLYFFWWRTMRGYYVTERTQATRLVAMVSSFEQSNAKQDALVKYLLAVISDYQVDDKESGSFLLQITLHIFQWKFCSSEYATSIITHLYRALSWWKFTSKALNKK